MERSTPLGFVAGIALIAAAVVFGSEWRSFFDLSSLGIVMGGTLAALLISHSFSEIGVTGRVVREFLRFRDPDYHTHVHRFTEFARRARREGLLSLEQDLEKLDHSLTRMGLELAIDGAEEERIHTLMSIRISHAMQPRQAAARVFSSAGSYAPAFGMIGTLIGLIQMLQNLTNPAAIGPAMAVAIMTTFYGAMAANLVFLPVAAKIRSQAVGLMREAEIIREGVLAIARGDAPSLVERRLSAMLDQPIGPAAPRKAIRLFTRAA